MIVFGLGSGRCGTNSLAQLLNSQPGVLCFHEANPSSMAWEGAELNIAAIIEQFIALIHADKVAITTDLRVPDRSAPLRELEPDTPIYCVGDIALYYLPYVEKILQISHEVRFPCLKRDRDKTIESFVKKLETKGYSKLTRFKFSLTGRSTLRNPWADNKSRKWRRDRVWDPLFPKLGTQSGQLEDFVGDWYDFYYETADELATKYPDHVKVFDTNALNSQTGQNAILQFCGINTGNAEFIPVHANKNVP